MTLPTIIAATLAAFIGIVIGAMWGLSRHAELLDWLQARTIRRWMAAMQSCGWKQEDIDMVLERMGDRIMPPYIPAPPPPPAKQSLDDKLKEAKVGVAMYYTVSEDDHELIKRMALRYAKMLHEAADKNDEHELAVLCATMRDEWKDRSEHDYGLCEMAVTVNEKHRDLDGQIYVFFDVGV